jgi:hypothetical protein
MIPIDREGEGYLVECTLGLRHGVKGAVAVRWKVIVRRLLISENRSQSAKRRQALLESNLPRNSRLELIASDGHWE